MAKNLERQLNSLQNLLNSLPETKEPPATTLQILGRSHQEKDWQRLFFYFLSPEKQHGLGDELLEHILAALSNRDDLDYTFSRYDLTDIQIAKEVNTTRGRPDAILWSGEDWFICWELKVNASESRGQTQAYVDVESFQSIQLEKDSVPTDDHFYVYLAPAEADPPEANEFVEISWEWIASEFQSFLAESHGEYPARTTAQLNDFIDTIRNEINMTDHQRNQQEKAELFLDYYNEITEVQTAFKNQWEDFTNTWGTRLAQDLDRAEIVTNSEIPAEHVPLKLKRQDGTTHQWILRQGMADWGGILKDGWWKRTDNLSNIYVRPEDDQLAGVSFYHRLKHNRDLAIEDKILEIQFWHSASNSNEYIKNFNRIFSDHREEIQNHLPLTAELPKTTDTKKKLFTMKYDINLSEHDGFFQAYTGALKQAFLELVNENPSLIAVLDQVYEKSTNMYR